jgi:hypothetical protein
MVQDHLETENYPRSDWGKDMVVISDEYDEGEWIMFNPDEAEVDLSEWR